MSKDLHVPDARAFAASFVVSVSPLSLLLVSAHLVTKELPTDTSVLRPRRICRCRLTAQGRSEALKARVCLS